MLLPHFWDTNLLTLQLSLYSMKTVPSTMKKTQPKLRDRLKNVERAVIPGFYGADVNGVVRTFSRGGSDVTGSIIASAVKADVYENWTDVSGFLVADPRIVENPKAINVITYKGTA